MVCHVNSVDCNIAIDICVLKKIIKFNNEFCFKDEFSLRTLYLRRSDTVPRLVALSASNQAKIQDRITP